MLPSHQSPGPIESCLDSKGSSHQLGPFFGFQLLFMDSESVYGVTQTWGILLLLVLFVVSAAGEPESLLLTEVDT